MDAGKAAGNVMRRGVVYIAYGAKAFELREKAIINLKQYTDLPIYTISPDVAMSSDRRASRFAKTSMLDLMPFDQALYMDVDTMVRGDISAGFEALDGGYDLALAISSNQGENAFWHVGEQEVSQMCEWLGYAPLQFQCGVMFIDRNERTELFFERWYAEWVQFEGEDQAAFVRALHQIPLKVWLLGQPWNGGALINHNFGGMR